MECPTCDFKLSILQNTKFILRYMLKKATSCPYCNATIYRQTNPTWEYLKLIFFSAFLIGVVFFFLAIIFGKQIDYKSTLIICFWFWLIGVGVIFSIVLLNVIFIFANKMYHKIIKSKAE